MRITALILMLTLATLGCSAPKAAGTEAKSEEKPGIGTGKPIPQFDLVKLDGGSLKSADLKGKVTVIDFWATWCESCLPEIPHYNNLQKKYSAKGANVVGFTMDSGNAKEIKPKAQGFKIEYPLVVGNEDVAAAFGIFGYPTTFLIAQDGTIYRKYIGAIPGKQEKLEKDIDTLLQNASN